MSDLSQMTPPGAQLAGLRPPTGAVPGGLVQGAGGTLFSAQAAQATRPTSEAPKEDAGTEKKKRKKPVKPIALAVVLLLVGYVAKGKFIKPHYGPGAKVPLGEIVDLGTVTTNLSDGHLAQIGVSLQMTVAENAKEVANDTSELLGSVVTAIGQETYAALLPASGRAVLAARLLQAFQRDLGTSEGAQQVAAVYFTSFVLQ